MEKTIHTTRGNIIISTLAKDYEMPAIAINIKTTQDAVTLDAICAVVLAADAAIPAIKRMANVNNFLAFVEATITRCLHEHRIPTGCPAAVAAALEILIAS